MWKHPIKIFSCRKNVNVIPDFIPKCPKNGRMTPNEIGMLYRFDVFDSVFDDINLNDVWTTFRKGEVCHIEYLAYIKDSSLLQNVTFVKMG